MKTEEGDRQTKGVVVVVVVGAGLSLSLSLSLRVVVHARRCFLPYKQHTRLRSCLSM